MKLTPGPSMTLGSAAAAQVRLIVWCKACQHQVEPDPAEMAARYTADTSVIDWRERLVCSKCGGRLADMVVTGTRRRRGVVAIRAPGRPGQASPPNFCESWRRRLSLKGDGKQRVEMTAVADDDPFREARIVSLLADPVDIDAGREQVCASVAHDAHDQKRRLGRNAVRPGLTGAPADQQYGGSSGARKCW